MKFYEGYEEKATDEEFRVFGGVIEVPLSLGAHFQDSGRMEVKYGL